ncbi:MAG: hypothetical protein AB7O67_10720 [Vicinamibacterales bacterium]
MTDPGAPDYCREIEAHLCRKNDGHLIRIVGPAFEQVLGWQRDGIPLRVALAGIDRYFERYYRKGPRRRPVRVEFCDADVRDAFDDWRRAVGVPGGERAPAGTAGEAEPAARPKRSSLAAHVERVVSRLTMLRGSDRGAGALDDALERAARRTDALGADARSARGEARERIVAELAVIDHELLDAAEAALDAATRAALEADAASELAPFKGRMPPDALAAAHAAAVQRLLRERFALPKVAFD